jgi:hypothetical protein
MSLPETKPQCPVLDQPLHSHGDEDDDKKNEGGGSGETNYILETYREVKNDEI